MDWYRAYSEAPRDLKLRRLAREMQTSLAEALGIWHVIMCIANESPERGKLLIGAHVPATNPDLEAAAGIDNIGGWLEALAALGMLHQAGGVWIVTNWNKRQFTSDDAAARVKKHREKLQGTRNGLVTLQDRYSNVSVTPPETDTETEADTEKEREGADAPPTPPSETPSKAKTDNTLLIGLTPGGLILTNKYAEFAGSQGKTSTLACYKNQQQRKAFEVIYAKLGNELASLIDKGFAHDRTSITAMLSWLENCAKRNEQGDYGNRNNNGNSPSKPTLGNRQPPTAARPRS